MSIARVVPIRIIVALLAVMATPSFAQTEAATDPFAAFAPHSTVSRYQIDHQPWTAFLSRAVYVTGRSTREPARRGDSGRNIGTRLSTASRSRYRFEGNRVLFHTFNQDVRDYVRVYREALQDTVNRIDYGDLSRDEQLAFWLNLYNAVVVDEIARTHPISRPARIRPDDGGGAGLYDARIISVHGVTLSLNDIRYNIVYRYWRNPNVIYGFWDGVISSPNIQSIAYTGPSVRRMLENNAREFVNSLRGVDVVRGRLRISKYYFEARQFYFPDWPTDLYNHLTFYADAGAATAIADRPARLHENQFDAAAADAENGETIRVVGNDNPAQVMAGGDNGRVWNQISSTAMRGGLSGEALALSRRVEERQSRRTGTVTILDIRTNDAAPAGETLSVESDEDAEAQGEGSD